MCDTEAFLMHGMFGTRSPVLAFSLTALTLALSSTASSEALAGPSSGSSPTANHVRRTARITDAEPSREDHDGTESAACHNTKTAVEIVAGDEKETLALTKCDGSSIPASLDKLSVLARPHGMAKPKELTSEPHATDVAPGIRRLDARLAQRLETMAEHFHKDGETTKIALVSGSKNKNAGSYHASGRALDFRIEGADDEAVAAFCKTMQDTGCGFYPNAGFVHIDVRDPGTGHVAWIDVSKPGEAPKYVTAWEKKEEPAKTETAKSDKSEPAKAEAPKEAAKAEVAKCEAKPEPKAESKDSKVEAKADTKSEPKEEKTADNRDASKLPSLPAAVTVAPVAPAAETPRTGTTTTDDAAPTPAKKTHKRRRHTRHVDHTI